MNKWTSVLLKHKLKDHKPLLPLNVPDIWQVLDPLKQGMKIHGYLSYASVMLVASLVTKEKLFQLMKICLPQLLLFSRQQAPQTEPKVAAKDISDAEGLEYDVHGVMDQSRETVDTYVIAAMDEVTPEEYQHALQQSVIDRQCARQKSCVVGNKSTWDYLNSLTGILWD